MRRAAEGLFRLPQAGQNVHGRGNPEGLRSRTSPLWEATLFDILQAYGQSRSKAEIRQHKVPQPLVMTLDDARTRLRRAMLNAGSGPDDWVSLEGLLPKVNDLTLEIPHESVKASSLVAGLELAKHGDLELRQSGSFAPIFVRGRQKEDKT